MRRPRSRTFKGLGLHTSIGRYSTWLQQVCGINMPCGVPEPAWHMYGVGAKYFTNSIEVKIYITCKNQRLYPSPINKLPLWDTLPYQVLPYRGRLSPLHLYPLYTTSTEICIAMRRALIYKRLYNTQSPRPER